MPSLHRPPTDVSANTLVQAALTGVAAYTGADPRYLAAANAAWQNRGAIMRAGQMAYDGAQFAKRLFPQAGQTKPGGMIEYSPEVKDKLRMQAQHIREAEFLPVLSGKRDGVEYLNDSVAATYNTRKWYRTATSDSSSSAGPLELKRDRTPMPSMHRPTRTIAAGMPTTYVARRGGGPWAFYQKVKRWRRKRRGSETTKGRARRFRR